MRLSLSDERALRKWERLDPPDEEPDYEYTCCSCDREAEYKVNGDYYCLECMCEEFRI